MDTPSFSNRFEHLLDAVDRALDGIESGSMRPRIIIRREEGVGHFSGEIVLESVKPVSDAASAAVAVLPQPF